VYALLFQNVQPNAGTPGISVQPSSPAPAGPPPQQPSPLLTFLPLLALVPIFFMMSRRSKKEADARAKLKKGDRIASQSGLVGELVELDERFAKVKLGPGTTVTMLASSIQPLEAAAPAAKAEEKDLKDLKDAKAVADKK
jgi:preprotein translocase subunit YajC